MFLKFKQNASFTIENNIIKGMETPYNETKEVGKILLDILQNNPQHIGQVQYIKYFCYFTFTKLIKHNFLIHFICR